MWIAFKNLIFDYWTQPVSHRCHDQRSCELLSKILSLTIEHNVTLTPLLITTVVNCFQKSYLWLLNTTTAVRCRFALMLWIAFKNLIFDYWTQLALAKAENGFGCELLSKILSLTIEHNTNKQHTTRQAVVNCFQKSYLWLLNTTFGSGDYFCQTLWIAFKNLIFDYWTQHWCDSKGYVWRCELLSKILSLTIEHNDIKAYRAENIVVNCFQKSYLWLLNTTIWVKSQTLQGLWIAFKNLIFDYWTQQWHKNKQGSQGCELLSKILSVTIKHMTKF